MLGVILRSSGVVALLAALLYVGVRAELDQRQPLSPLSADPLLIESPLAELLANLETRPSVIQRPHRVYTSARHERRPYFNRPLFGLHTDEGPVSIASYARIEAMVGRHAAILEWPVDFSQPFPRQLLDKIVRHGSMPMVTWEPWDNSDPRKRRASGPNAEQPLYRLRTFISGRHDAYLRAYARGFRDFSRPVLLRFAPEMNGWWNSWSEAANMNRRGEFVKAWRHAVSIFRAEGAHNVLWIWSPNVVYPKGEPKVETLRRLYPGDAWVDLIGLDGYNWGDSQQWSSWRSFQAVFGPSLREVRRFSKRPLFISETGSTEDGGDKPAWIKSFFAELARNPDIVGFVWFNRRKETDWRIESSPQSLDAFKRSIAITADRPEPLVEYFYDVAIKRAR